MSTSLKNLHGDIIYGEIPNNQDDKDSLLLEIKTRANTAYKKKNYEEAYILYTRAIEVFPDSYTIYGNRCLTLIKMDKLEEAMVDAHNCQRLNPEWSKGYYRMGQVYEKIGRNREAIKYYKKSQNPEIDPATQKKIEKLNKLIENIPKPKAVETKLPAKNSYKKNTKITNNSDLRGYKTKKDGRKTTFFDHEQTQEEKDLIGDITPQRIDIGDVAIPKINKIGLGSAWSNGSTYEEKNLTNWATSYLDRAFKNIEFKMEPTENIIRISKIEKLEGFATISLIKNSKRYLSNFKFNIHWYFSRNNKKTKGELQYKEVDNDYQITDKPVVKGKKLTPELENYILNPENSLHREIHQCIEMFHNDFKNLD